MAGNNTVWVRYLPVAPLPAHWVDLLSADEQARIAALRHPLDRRSHMAAHALKRLVLGERLGVPPAGLGFRTGMRGKPELDGPAAIQFNLSHTRTLVCVAVARGRKVGIDVERITPGLIDADMEAEMFTPAERARLDGLAEPARLRAAVAQWTLKEAALKALGRGLDDGLGAFELDPAVWQTHQAVIEEGHVLSVAVLGGGVVFDVRQQEVFFEK